MKIKRLASAFSAALLLVALSAGAQENSNRYSDGSIQRGPYLTNTGADNWFFGVGAGVNAMYDNRLFGGYGFAIDANLGKWFTPAVGFRAGYHGLKDTAADPNGWFTGSDPFNYHLAYADAMWNIATTLGGYKESRVWNPILYGRSAALFTSAAGSGQIRHDFGMGAGLLNEFRLGKHVGLSIDLSAIVSREKEWRNYGRFSFFPSATAGLVFHLGKSGFVRHANALPAIDVPDPAIIEKLRSQLAKADSDLAAANGSIATLRNQLARYSGLQDGKTYDYKDGVFTETVIKEVEREMIVPEILYFDLGKATLGDRELARLEYYAENTFKKTQKLLVTGCADLGTGSKEVNDRLSRLRAEYVKGVLVDRFGYNASNIETKADVMPGDAPIKGRIVTIEVQ